MVSLQEEDRTRRDTHKRTPRDDGGRHWSDISTSQRTPRIVGIWEQVKKDASLEPLEGIWSADTLISKF